MTSATRFFASLGVALGVSFSALLLAAPPAAASPPKQWEAAQAQARMACVKASEFRNAKLVGTPALFDDTAPLTAMVIRGTYPQEHMKGQIGTVLCLYDRKTRDARTVEWAPPSN